MANRRKRTNQVKQKQETHEAPVVKEEVLPVESPEEIKPVYSFPSRSLCPRCGTIDTIAVSTQNRIQYRVCRSGICRHRYTVAGKEL